MEKHKKLVRVVCLVLAALMVMTIGVPLIFAYAETPAEKLERLRKELEDIKSNISAVENSKEKSEQTKQYYQAQANNLKAQLAAIKEDIAAQQQSIELKNAEVAEKAANVAYNKSMFESRLKGMYEMSRQSNLAILLGIDDVSQMLLFAENLQQISEHDTQLVQQLRDEQAALEAQRAELEQQLADLAARETPPWRIPMPSSRRMQPSARLRRTLPQMKRLWRKPRGSTSRRRKNGGSGRRQTTWISSTIRAALPGLSRGIRTFPPISAWDAGSTASGTCTAAWMCRPRRGQKSMRLRTAW